jgi:hypothetical protein
MNKGRKIRPKAKMHMGVLFKSRARWILVLGAAYWLSTLGPANGEEPKISDLAVAGAKFGVTFFKGLGAEYNSAQAELAYKTQSRDVLQSDLTSLGDAYKAQKEAARSTADFAQAAGSTLISSLVVIGTVSGVGAVPSALLAAGANYANDQVSKGLREAADARAMTFLNQGLQNWNAASGVDYDTIVRKLNNKDAVGAAADFDRATGMLTRLRSQFQDDPSAAQAAENFVLKTMQTYQKATILKTAQNTSVIENVEKDLSNQIKFTRRYAEKTNTMLDAYSAKLEQANKSIFDASQQLSSLQNSQMVTARQVGVIQDILYQQQSPATKIFLLQNNYRPELSGEQRTQLVSYLQAQQRREELVTDSANFMNSVKEVQGILSNLGIRDPTISKAVQIGTVAQKAFSAVLTGNYLGAISAVTSIFGLGGSDPEAERFGQIMGYLQQMDKKLDGILNLQVKTLNAIYALSNQVADMDRRLNQRLDHVDFELKTISQNLKEHMWERYLPCNTVWRDRKDGVRFDDDLLAFRSYLDLSRFMRKSQGKAIACARSLDDLYGSINGTKVFGQLLSMRGAVTFDFSLLPSEKESNSAFSREQLGAFLNELFLPSVGLVSEKWDPDWGHTATLFALLGDPAMDVATLQKRLEFLSAVKTSGHPLHACSRPTILSYRMRSLFCGDSRYGERDVPVVVSPSAEALALESTRAYLSDPLVRDQLISLINWTGLVARPYDFSTGVNENAFSLDQLLNSEGVPRGKDLMWSALSVLDIAVAQQTVLHGDLTAQIIYDLAWDKAAHRPVETAPNLSAQQLAAAKLLRNANNPWLGKNVLSIALRNSLRIQGKDLDAAVPYAKALGELDAIRDANQPTQSEQAIVHQMEFFLKGLFTLGNEVHFLVEDKEDGFGGHARKLSLISGSYKFEMPSPAEFSRKALVYPPTLIQLLRKREILVERLVDYNLLSDVPDKEQQKRVAALLFSGSTDRGDRANQ